MGPPGSPAGPSADPSPTSASTALADARTPATKVETPAAPDIGGHGRTNIFDSDRTGTNVVFIIDNSLSMRSKGKTDAVRRELWQKLEAMKPSQNFYVMFFHSGGFDAMPSSGPIPATAENVRALTNWLFSVGHRFGSDPTLAVEHALGLAPAPDTLWLLSDGQFSKKTTDLIREANRSVHAAINTVGIYSRDGEAVMREIAKENHGIYRLVPPPDKKAALVQAVASDGNPPLSP